MYYYKSCLWFNRQRARSTSCYIGSLIYLPRILFFWGQKKCMIKATQMVVCIKSTRSCDVTKLFFAFLKAFWTPCIGGPWWKTSTTQNGWKTVHGGPEIWPLEYLLAPLKSVWIGLVHNSNEAGQCTLISMGLITYSCGHISGHNELIHVKFGVWRFSCSTEIWSWKCCNAKMKIWWRH